MHGTRVDRGYVRKYVNLVFSLQSRTHVIILFIPFATSIGRCNIFQQLFSFFEASSHAARCEFWSERETGKSIAD